MKTLELSITAEVEDLINGPVFMRRVADLLLELSETFSSVRFGGSRDRVFDDGIRLRVSYGLKPSDALEAQWHALKDDFEET